MQRSQKVRERPVPLAIVGGGAAGMFAATVAAQRGLGCVIFERKARLGAKVLMTANGRCNFTKDVPVDTLLRELGEPAASWAARALRECTPQAIARGFRSLGVGIRRMEDGRLFPDSGQAATIVHAFGDVLRDAGVPICSNCPVTDVAQSDGGFLVQTENFSLRAQNVLIATGGVSFPKTGSVGDGQNFARALGHRIEPLRPGLVGFEVDDRTVTDRAGARFENGSARVLDAAGRVVHACRGEVDCERWGLGGAAVYNCQRWMAHHPADGGYAIEIRFGDDRRVLRNPTPRPLKEAIVTIGGVSLDDVDAGTMMSRKMPGLYFAGEVLDVDGPTGGFNLTLAFATGRLAAMSCLARRKVLG
ncbi:MAG: aminoacetone oxidase family FAD-binding enzyme [Kiritimatiellia bacterium]